MRLFSLLLAILTCASPAHATSGTPVPEPSNMALFGLGLTGLIVGRIISRRKRDKPDD